MNICKILIIVPLIICLFSCTKKVNVQITNYIKDNCDLNTQEDSCMIDLKDIINMEWDTMYIFPSWTMPEDISSTLGIKYDKDYVKDDTNRTILMKNKEIILDEDNSGWSDYAIVFAYTAWPDQIRKYSTTKFYVRKMQGEHNSFFYKLFPAL